MIPDLLQTAAYARAVVRSSATVPEGELETRLKARLKVRNQLSRNLTCVFYLHELAVRFHVDTSRTHVEQARHLLFMAARPNITIRVLPAEYGAHAGLRGPFTQLSFHKYPPLVWLEGENSSLVVDDKDAVEGYDKVVSSLNEASLGADESKAVINGLARTAEGSR